MRAVRHAVNLEEGVTEPVHQFQGGSIDLKSLKDMSTRTSFKKKGKKRLHSNIDKEKGKLH